MDNNIFIELREQEASQNYERGSWTNDIQKTVVEEGDQIVIAKSFIDTNTISQTKITIPTDYDIGYEFIYYVIKDSYITAKAITTDGYGGKAQDASTIQAGLSYVPCLVGAKADTNLRFMATFSYTFAKSGSTTLQGYGGVTIGISYSDAERQPTTQSFNLPRERIKEFGSNRVTITCNIMYDYRDPITVSSPSEHSLRKLNTEVDFGAEEEITEETYTPVIGSYTATLKAGAYSPQELVRQLNLMTQVNSQPLPTHVTADPQWNRTSSEFLTSSIKISNDTSLVWWEASTEDREGVSTYTQPNTYNTYVGASQVEWAYDENANKFYINYLHTPFYDYSSGAEALYYEKVATDNTEDYPNSWAITKIGGILFTGLFAVEADTQDHVDFFEGIMKFDLNTLLTKWDFRNSPPTGAVIARYPRVQIKEGINATSAFLSTDSLLLKKADDDFDQKLVPTVSPTPTSLSTTTIGIYASETITNNLFQFPYFMLELNAGYLNNLYSKDKNSRNIKSIVGRFYTNGSFTTGSESDSLNYVHQGDPIYLSDFSIRVLNPDRQIPPNIGDNSTVFLNLIKAPKPPPQIQ